MIGQQRSEPVYQRARALWLTLEQRRPNEAGAWSNGAAFFEIGGELEPAEKYAIRALVVEAGRL